jgi:hypothetical protein
MTASISVVVQDEVLRVVSVAAARMFPPFRSYGYRGSLRIMVGCFPLAAAPERKSAQSA